MERPYVIHTVHMRVGKRGRVQSFYTHGSPATLVAWVRTSRPRKRGWSVVEPKKTRP